MFDVLTELVAAITGTSLNFCTCLGEFANLVGPEKLADIPVADVCLATIFQRFRNYPSSLCRAVLKILQSLVFCRDPDVSPDRKICVW